MKQRGSLTLPSPAGGISQSDADARYFRIANNLSEGVAATMRTSLGLGSIATQAAGTGVATALGVNVGTAGAFIVNGGALGTPSSGTLTNCTFPTLNQNTTGSAASLSISGQTGLLTFTGVTSTNREKTVRDAADTILELGGTYSPTGIWTFANTTDASSKTTGAVVISGGLGVAKTLHANVIYGYGGTDGDQLGGGILLVHPGNPNNAIGVGVQIWNNWCLHWRTTNSVGLFGDLADTLWLRNSTRSQAALVANTYTSSTSYEAAGVWWASNVAYFGTQKGSGGGSARDVSLVRDSTVKFTVNANTNDHEQPAKMKVYAVGSLPAAGTVGAYSIAAVNDALAPTVGAAVAGGGAASALVCSNGTNWIVIATL